MVVGIGGVRWSWLKGSWTDGRESMSERVDVCVCVCVCVCEDAGQRDCSSDAMLPHPLSGMGEFAY